jgi:hypothetical protein
MWLTNALNDLNVPVTNPAMFCDNKATIDITYNHKIDHQSKSIEVTYHLVCETIKSGPLSLLQLKSAENLGDIGTKGLHR